LEKEKELTRQKDQVAKLRQELPWVSVEHDYELVGPKGVVKLSDLFKNKKQLIVVWFMWSENHEKPCPWCSCWADGYNGVFDHIRQRDTEFVVVSKASIDKIEKVKALKGWTFPWYSNAKNTFGEDFGASFPPKSVGKEEGSINFKKSKIFMDQMPGTSVFAKQDGKIYHTYSCWSRGIDNLNAAYNYIDLLPFGRQEEKGKGMYWLKHKEDYEK